MDKSKIDILCNYLNNNVEQRYPIANNELSGSTDFIKNGYLKMLAVVLQQSGTITDAQLGVFKRIVSGAKTDKSVEDYLRMALDIDIEDYIEFSNECRNLTLKYRWLLDVLVITCVQEQQDEQLRLIAQFVESYEITKRELEYIATMAKAIIAMDETAYVSVYEIKEDSIPDTVFSDYMFLLSNKCICANDNMTIFQQTQKQKISIQILEKIKEINTPCVKIIGAHIKVDECEIGFENRKQVILENCTFLGGKRNPIYFYNCDEVVLSNCKFEGFKTRTVVFDEIKNIQVSGCIFSCCKYRHVDSYGSWPSLGGVMYSDEPSSIGRCDLINTSFNECGGINLVSNCYSEFISNILTFADRCSFVNCWHMHSDLNGVYTDREDEERTMFTKQSSATNCTYENSAKFN